MINGLAGAGLNQAREGSFARLVIEKPYGRDLATAHELDGDRARRVRRAAGLPDRPLPGQGHRPERARAALRQLDLPADLGPQLGRPRADHRGRDARRRHPRRLLRARRRDARHRAEPRAPGARAGPDGAAGLVRRRGAAQREGQAAAGDPAAHQPGHRRPGGARPVHPRRHPRRPDGRLPRGGRRRPAVAHRDVRGDAAQRRQLAVGGRAVLRAYRQAAAGPGHRGGAAVPAPAAPADPARTSSPSWRRTR